MESIKRNQIIDLEITAVAFGGKGIAKIATEKGDYVLFVPNTIKGQKVRARVVKRKSSFAECKLVEVLEKSPDEVTLPYQAISGAPYATLPIEIQHQNKQEQVFDIYKKLAKLPNVEELFDEYIGSPENWHYRNKMEYSFSAIGFDVEKQEEFDGFALGFKKRGTWWIVENLEKDSGLFDAEFENKLREIRLFCEKSGLPAWHPPKKEGFFRFLVVRKSYQTGKLLIKLVTSSNGLDKFDFEGFVALLNQLFPDRIEGIIHTTNDDIGDNAQSRLGVETVLYGNSVISETLLGLSFEVSMQSFFQTNPKCAELLYQKAVSYAVEGKADFKDKTIMDLFCGTGTIGQIMAAKTNAKVIGVDIVAEAIENAKENAAKNNVSNVSFYAADVNKFLFDYPEYAGKIDTIILDPPRAGIAKKALQKVLELGANRIVYVSCNPATQARDILEIKEKGYELKKFSLVDQFPHTAHIESVALFSLD